MLYLRLLAVPLLALAACQTTPITGSLAFNVFSIADDCELGTEAYTQFTSGASVVTTNWGQTGEWKKTVERAMQNLSSVADQQGFAYEVKLIKEDETVNAWCLPCGKMAVYTGILPVAQDEAGLAVVMGHEIGHAIARHGTQRMSKDSIAQAALSLLGDENYEQLGAMAYDMIISLPYSRKNELEADHIGLILMARAGYDPRGAIDFWQRMEALGGSGGPEFLSTHPSNGKRIDELQQLMPEALAIYQGLQPK
jgi:predicted Zn-dependent protease